MNQPTSYAFTTGRKAGDQFDALQRFLDRHTMVWLDQIGIAPGARCWEAGAGGGSIARWLASGVGSTGYVVATDTDISHVQATGTLHIYEHDVHDDTPPPGGPFDLVHARLVLMHLPDRHAILNRFRAATTPGGWIVVEEFDCTTPPRVLRTPHPDAADLFTRYIDTLFSVLRGRGVDLGWAHYVHPAMAQAGLTHIHTQTYSESWAGGGYGCRLHDANSRQLEGPLIDAGLTPADLDRLRALWRDPGFEVMSYQFVSTRGQLQ